MIKALLPNKKTIIELRQEDLLGISGIEILVNAANNKLMHGGGIAGAIVNEGGYSI